MTHESENAVARIRAMAGPGMVATRPRRATRLRRSSWAAVSAVPVRAQARRRQTRRWIPPLVARRYRVRDMRCTGTGTRDRQVSHPVHVLVTSTEAPQVTQARVRLIPDTYLALAIHRTAECAPHHRLAARLRRILPRINSTRSIFVIVSSTQNRQATL